MQKKEWRRVWIRIAASRNRIQSDNDWRHWRLFVDPGIQEIAAAGVSLSQNGRQFLTAGTDKSPNEHGLYVWLESRGSLALDSGTGVLNLSSNGGEPLFFSVNTANLYKPDNWNHWLAYGQDGSLNQAAELAFTLDGGPVSLKAVSGKELDEERGLLAWLHVFGNLSVDADAMARIDLLPL